MGVHLAVRSCWSSPSGGEEELVYEFDQSRIVIGRGRGADVRLPHRAVSVRHATIEAQGTRYTIVDHGATNGTLVQGARIVSGRPKPLRDGDRIEVGGFAVVFRCGVPVVRATTTEGTASLARRLVRSSLTDARTIEPPTLTVLNGPAEGREHALPAPPARLVIGRDEAADVPLDDADASREHAELEVRLDGVWLRDLASKNGVAVNGRAARERRLADRDELQVGATVLRFEDPARAEVEALEEGDDEAVEPPRYEEPEPDEPEPPEEGEAEATLAEAPSPEALEGGAAGPAAPKRARRDVAPADLVIYVLAAAVFAISLLGLLWLLRSG